MRILVTGGAGFIGSHVVDLLRERGQEVLVLDDLSTGRRANLPDGEEIAEVDVRDRAWVDGVVGAFAPNVVCHLAAQSSVTASVDDPRADLDVNVAGTMHVAEAAAAVGAPVVFASSGGALYGDSGPFPSPEDAPCQPVAPYGASKLAGEAYVRAWARRYALPYAILRPGNVYGPRQRSDREAGVVAIFSDHLRRGERPTVYGYGKQTGDYVHVRDVARAFLYAAFDVAAGESGTYNVSSGTERTPLDILAALQAEAGTNLEPILVSLRPGELTRNCLDSSLIRERLGWEPTVDLPSGLASTYRELAR